MSELYLLLIADRPAGRLYRFSGGFQEYGGYSPRHAQTFTLTSGVSMSSVFYRWIDPAKPQRIDGSIITLNHDLTGARRIDFNNALVSSLTFPEMQRSSKTLGTMTVAFIADQVVNNNPEKKVGLGVYGGNSAPWSISDFRLTIDGLDCSQVSRVAPIQIEQKIVAGAAGRGVQAEHLPAGLQYDGLQITLPGKFADGFAKWLETSNRGEAQWQRYKQGSLEFSAPGSGKAYFTINFENLEITQIQRQATKDSKDTYAPVTVSMNTGAMSWAFNAAAVR